MRTGTWTTASRCAAVTWAVCWSATLFTACADSPSPSDRAIASAVRVEAEGCQERPSIGGGSFVGPNQVLTVAHVVAGSTDIDVVLSNGKEADAHVVAIDRKKDLAVLSVEATRTPLPLGFMRPGAQGVFVVWRDDEPMASPFTARSFVDINASDIDHDGPGVRRGYQIEAKVTKGDSGSVLVHDGVAVAVVFARSTSNEQRAWATDALEARQLIAGAGSDQIDTGDCPKG